MVVDEMVGNWLKTDNLSSHLLSFLSFEISGDMVYYESARLLHGRPQPMDGEMIR